MKKKINKKIVFLSILDVLLAVGLVVAAYFTFFADRELRNLGYSYAEINTIKQNNLEEKVTEYNQTLAYAINSADFDANNIEYYLLFNTQVDYTKIINDLAAKYSIDEIKSFQQYLTDDQLIELIDLDKVENTDGFKLLFDKGYTFEESLKVVDKLDAQQLEALLSLPKLEYPENYARMIETGYSPSTIAKIYNISEKDFNYLSAIKYFSDLDELLDIDGFLPENLARYYWHMENYGSSYERAVTRVNIDAEYVSQYYLDYLDFYDSYYEVQANMNTITGLVNKTHYLSENYVPENLVEVDARYRGNNQMLVQEVAEAFIKMSDDCYNAIERRILAYSNYRSYADEQAFYDNALATAGGYESSVADFATRAGYSEHQTGLAIDISPDDYNYSEFEDYLAYDWVNENCYNYGFIRRYPSSKAWITGYAGNAYHYRYVGLEAAEIINNYDWVLEEYAYLYN